MKNIKQKLSAFIAIILLALFMTACGENTYAELNDLQAQNEKLQKRLDELENEKNNTVAPVAEVDMTEIITEPVTTTERPVTEITEPPTTTEKLTEVPTTTEEPTTEKSIKSDWEFSFYVDQFKQPTDEGFIFNVSAGVFSNSATTNSDLIVSFTVDDSDVTITLYEYGRSVVKNSSTRNSVKYDMIMRTPDNIKHNLTGTMYTNGDRIFIDDKYKENVINALSGDGIISFYIENTDRRTTNYLFDITASNFADKYQLLK